MLNQITTAKREAWAKFVKLFPKLASFPEPSIRINNRLSSTAGRCFYESNEIDISSKLFAIDPQEILNQTVPHEVAHQVAYNLFGDTGHGAAWKQCMVAYGLEPARCHSIGQEKLAPSAIEREAHRAEFSLGARVRFEAKGFKYSGHVVKVNRVTVKVQVSGPYAGVWTVPLANETLKPYA